MGFITKMAIFPKWLIPFMVVTTSLTSAYECPTDEGWLDAAELGWFFFGDVYMTWFQAADYCYKKGDGSVLAEIYDEETDLVVKIFSNQGKNKNRGYWLGGSDIYHEGTWTWFSGAQFDYSRWFGGRPLNGTVGSKGANCIFLFQDTENEGRPWLDVGCFKNIYPLCMKMDL